MHGNTSGSVLQLYHHPPFISVEIHALSDIGVSFTITVAG